MECILKYINHFGENYRNFIKNLKKKKEKVNKDMKIVWVAAEQRKTFERKTIFYFTKI